MTGPSATEASHAPIDPRRTRRRKSTFYILMGLAVFLTAFVAFAPSFYLKPYFDHAPLTPLVHLHAVVFTLWLAAFLVQSLLSAAKRLRIHRRLGFAFAALALPMVALGSAVAISQGARGRDAPDRASLKGMIIPLTDMIMFSGLLGAGCYYRRRPEAHKRLMLLATIAILPGATARLPFEFIVVGGPPAYFAVADLFLLPCLVYDQRALGRVHLATLIGCSALVASQVLRLLIGRTQAWIDFAIWLTQ